MTLWLDPVCPFTWNTARWLQAAAEAGGAAIDWRLLNLAVLNEGRELPAAQQARMGDSRRVGRLMAAIRRDLGGDALMTAYFTFGEAYFDQSAPVDRELADKVLAAVGASQITPAVLDDDALDGVVAQSHQAAQDAYGATGGSPLLTTGGHTFFGPVFTELPALESVTADFAALVTLTAMPQFTQIERPRVH
ncbi:DsbA family protein [Mycobacterium sp. CBMA293]|uniref:mycothiol-dependent nitroreductase Rv2466c family protein n=1 Tax=unclassified Mycolicibacterium TaxID=2636767 RepID=UPI00132BBD55|nr:MULTISPECIES: DsbA family protein [unclassified Mycolicibacterium]MUL49369.1 DsbA family protein [Mycolicibacterium sp. CBMA 360]MUL96775.1 DsbA family protein [Mycolicibacterium sp. CBMA 230]MUM34067.1 DsbA family protein [Mycolicibacterium sp. CBMA 361]MUL57726.1 DsbA family protein [Mycolicibacterium sp. CBMA 335]MUL72825.1 DsbA family protein [Mycolicibacterium sp. CBMA 311]